MTDENKFFSYVWRFNAVVLACVAIAAGGAILYNIINSWRPATIDPVGHFAPVPKAAEQDFTYRLNSGNSRSVGREQVIFLGRWGGSPSAYGLQHMSSYDRSEPVSLGVNALAISRENAVSHWLFRGYGRSILSEDTISLSERWDSSGPIAPIAADFIRPVAAIAMTVIEADTNKDGKLSEKDRQSIYVYRDGMVEAVKLLTADLIVSAQQSGTDRLLVISESGKSATAATFSIPDFKLIAEKPLPNVPQ